MNIRKLAVEAIEKIISKKAFSNIVVNEFLNKYEFTKEEKALFTKLVYGTIQYMLTLEFYLEPFIGHKKQKPWVKYLLYLSVYQLMYLSIPEYAVVNEAVELANLKDKAVGSFVNAVLRNFLRNDLRSMHGLDEIETLSIKYSHPNWLVSFLLKDYNFETVEKILIENSQVKHDAIRVNTLKISKEEVKLRLNQDKITYHDSELADNGLTVEFPIQNHELFKSGEVTIQDISAQLVSEMLAPKENESILDVCSAPGGKSAHLSALMNNTGEIHACDIHPHKIKLMENLFKRLGVKNVKCQLVDSRHLKDIVKEETFDKVLADVPCSGLGVLSHKVDLKYNIDLNTIDEIKQLQAEIIESTWNLVKHGGIYLYSTCTINKEENEEQIRKFLEKHQDAEILEELTILPYEYHSDGFYICKIRRN